MLRTSRRQVLRLGVGAGVAASLPGWWSDDLLVHAGAAPPAGAREGTVAPATFFRPAELAWIKAALDRLIPRDVLGPGAVDAGVATFIDSQLGGRYGQAIDWYMAGPWEKGTDQQGYQLQRTPAELYRAAIAAIDAHCRQRFDQKVFAALAPEQQDGLLHELQNGKLELADVSGKTFFDLLWKNTKEGFFADPMYGGNRGFIGWKLVGFPGPRYNYVADIRHFGQPYPLPTVGILGRDPSRRAQVPA